MTGRDQFASDFSKQDLETRIRNFYDKSKTDEQIKQEYKVDSYRRFDVHTFREQYDFNSSCVKPSLFRPFDTRYVYYQQYLVQEWQYRVMKNMMSENKALIIGRQW